MNTIKSADYSYLKNKTLFDVCTHTEYLSEMCNLLGGEDNLRALWEANPNENAVVLLEYAEEVGNLVLQKAITEQLQSQINSYFNE